MIGVGVGIGLGPGLGVAVAVAVTVDVVVDVGWRRWYLYSIYIDIDVDVVYWRVDDDAMTSSTRNKERPEIILRTRANRTKLEASCLECGICWRRRRRSRWSVTVGAVGEVK